MVVVKMESRVGFWLGCFLGVNLIGYIYGLYVGKMGEFLIFYFSNWMYDCVIYWGSKRRKEVWFLIFLFGRSSG